METLIFIRKEKQVFQMIIIVLVAMIIGVFLILSGEWLQILIGIPLLISGPFIIGTQSDICYNPKTNQIITKRKILIFVNETKEILPEVQYIAVVNLSTSQTLNVASISTQITEKTCQVNFIHKNSKKKFTKLFTAPKEHALKSALEISEKINKPVLDNRNGKKVWFNQ